MVGAVASFYDLAIKKTTKKRKQQMKKIPRGKYREENTAKKIPRGTYREEYTVKNIPRRTYIRGLNGVSNLV